MRSKKWIAAGVMAAMMSALLPGCAKEDDVIVLRVANWEEYIDEGDWDEDELIDLEGGTEIFGDQSMVEDFQDWYLSTYGKEIRVEYSTFGTNEELYNQMTIGDVFDVVCPSEYMIMKLMREGKLVPFSEEFKDSEKQENAYTRGVSPYIRHRLSDMSIGGESLAKYAACYMWGTLGLVYNPEEVDEEDAKHWGLMAQDKYNKRITIKDSVRDAFFAAISMVYYDDIMKEEFRSSDDYYERLSELLNATDPETVDRVEAVLTDIKKHAYSFETDSGKADMVTGKVIANEQWSGDAVYTMDQADEDGVELYYSVPEESTNLWFDGWVMMKDGIGEDAEKQAAAEAFINYLSKPENAIRNMYYIGYTSSIAGGDSPLIFEYMDWCYGAEEDEEDEEGEDAEDAEDAEEGEDAEDAEDAEDEEDEPTVEYAVGYFFSEDEDADEEYCIITPESQTRRQLFAQYPPKEVVDRAVIMACFDDEDNERINHMWTNVRCFDLAGFFRGE